MGRQDSEVKAGQASLKEVVQTDEAEEQRKESCLATEAELPQNKVANEAKGDADFRGNPRGQAPAVQWGERGGRDLRPG